ncbi:MAG: type I-U CRISPR-associated protein Cas5/Cas6 [Alphaproteobacteria bacterium]|nr:type I-U CRISPR-associated protein Cas5/Cas6 [Alphaproteobacteria bacterium]
MALVLEIDHLLGVAFAARGAESALPDWPPQPDRVFSALVAAWGARGERADERIALEWLEKQPAPRIAASPFEARPAPISFVPPNDPVTGKSGDKTVMPALRRRQPRRFPAALPHDPLVALAWEADPEAPVLEALDALARDVAYVGHSASLTRCRFRTGDAPGETQQARRAVYEGRLAELERAFGRGERPAAGAFVRPEPRRDDTPESIVSPDWMVFEIVAGAIDLRAAPLACKELIKLVMSGYGAVEGAVPTVVSGHEADGAPAKDAHLAAVPLANLGWQYSDGGTMGLALAPPRGSDLLFDQDFLMALAKRAEEERDPHDEKKARRVLKLGESGLTLIVRADADRASMRPERYAARARRWATATPIVLDRHFKTKLGKGRGDGAARQDEIEALVAEAARRAVPGASAILRVVADRHAAIRGAPPTTARGPQWTRGWRVPESFASRPMTHAVIEFAAPVRGPLILGAGRHAGLGLCLPLDAERAP